MIRPTALAFVLAGLLVSTAGAAAVPGTTEARRGGTFRIALYVDPGGVRAVDPALALTAPEQLLVRTTCTPLMAFPGPRPGAAARPPRRSRNGRTYTFTIRTGLRFNTGEPVTARNFARTIERVLDPGMRAPITGPLLEFLRGASAFAEGRARTVAGVVARRRTLTLRLTKPWPDLLNELATARFCPVPLRFPVNPEGVPAPLPSSGPYTITRFVPRREVVLVRNRRYRGPRPQHVDSFSVDLANTFSGSSQRVVAGEADLATPAPDTLEELARRYGLNRSRLFAFPDPQFTTPRMLVLNTQRPLLRNNARLRRAISFAIDRRATTAIVGPNLLAPADQFLSPLTPGFREVRVYPPRADVRRARALARGRTRSGRAVMYVTEFPPFNRAIAELMKGQLSAIGLDVELRRFPHPEFLRRVAVPGEPFDMALSLGLVNGYTSPSSLRDLFHRRFLPPRCCNFARFDSARYNRLLDRAERLTGRARLRAYGRLDVELARDAVPSVPLVLPRGFVLVSGRAGCHDFRRPLFELSRLCLRR